MKAYIEITWNGTTSRVDFPHIVEIVDAYNASLTEISTLIYGAENRFVMDLGVQRSFDLNCVRINPDEYDDSSSADPSEWSNGKWITELIKKLDHWQNLMKPNGGFKLVIESPDKELYPDISKNVFLRGGITPKYTVNKMSFSLPLVVGSMRGDSTYIDTVTLTFKSGSNPPKTYTQTYPKDALVPVPAIPADWQGIVADSIFTHWTTSSGTKYKPGETVRWTSDTTLSANWQGPIDVQVFTDAGTKTCTVPAGAARVQVYAVGAGGGAGRTHNIRKESASTGVLSNKYYSGGAGGAGEVIITSRTVRSTSEITVDVGTGGSCGKDSHPEGYAGGSTTVKIDRHVVLARGGDGGLGATDSSYIAVLGGSKYYSGGMGGIEPTDGSTDESSSTPGIPGRKGDSRITSEDFQYHGGAGGGASPFNNRFNGTLYTSIGGDGSSNFQKNQGGQVGLAAKSGQYGGGAGSGNPNKNNTKGGDGFVALIFFA